MLFQIWLMVLKTAYQIVNGHIMIQANDSYMGIGNNRKTFGIVRITEKANTSHGSCASGINDNIIILHKFISRIFPQSFLIQIFGEGHINAASLDITFLGKHQCIAGCNISWRFPAFYVLHCKVR